MLCYLTKAKHNGTGVRKNASNARESRAKQEGGKYPFWYFEGGKCPSKKQNVQSMTESEARWNGNWAQGRYACQRMAQRSREREGEGGG